MTERDATPVLAFADGGRLHDDGFALLRGAIPAESCADWAMESSKMSTGACPGASCTASFCCTLV